MAATDEMICFALYSAARATTQAYRELLAPWSLTYPQYLALIVLWNDGDQTVSSLGKALQLDSGTLSPLVRRLEEAGYITRTRRADDERIVDISLTEAGAALRSEVETVRVEIAKCAGITNEEDHKRVLNELHALTAHLRN